MVIPNLLNDMEQNAIRQSVVLPVEYTDGIERSAQLIQNCRHVPHLIPFCSVHPNDPQCIKKLHKYLRMGAKGLKLHPNLQRISPHDRRFLELCSACAQYHLPLIIHSGLTGREGRFRSYRKFSSLELIEILPEYFPQIPVILAHAGIRQFEKALRLARKYKTVYLELSGQPAQHIKHALTVLGSERLLFGSDWPFWNQSLALRAIRQAVNGDKAVEHHILYKNAMSILT
jgi:predicted TIM-barrel fold metal-dependent hydrolase